MDRQLKVDLGPMPMNQQIGGAIEGGGLRDLLDRKELCDIVLVVGSHSYPAHSMVLAAASPNLCQLIHAQRAQGVRGFVAGLDRVALDIHLGSVTHPEAVQDMLDCIYGPFTDATKEPACKTEAANRDSIMLATSFQIPLLLEQASRWLIRNLNTQNVLTRLAICEEFQLVEVREKIMEQLISDPVVLPLLARDPEITKVPKVLQDLLIRILTLLGAGSAASTSPAPATAGKTQGRQARKAGA
jgi:hypothetical protein